MQRTEVSRILHATRLSLAELARLSAVHIHTIRSLASGRNTNPRPTTRRKLAAALRSHSATLSTLADQLDGP